MNTTTIKSTSQEISEIQDVLMNSFDGIGPHDPSLSYELIDSNNIRVKGTEAELEHLHFALSELGFTEYEVKEG